MASAAVRPDRPPGEGQQPVRRDELGLASRVDENLGLTGPVAGASQVLTSTAVLKPPTLVAMVMSTTVAW